MTATKTKLEKMVEQAVKILQEHAPPDGLTDHLAIDQYYRIFDSLAYWKALAKGSPATIRQEPSRIPQRDSGHTHQQFDLLKKSSRKHAR